MGQLADSSLGARYLGTNPWVMVAAPAYLGDRGTPQTAADIAMHACAHLQQRSGRRSLATIDAHGRARVGAGQGPLRTNNLSAVLAAARAGMGLAVLPWYVARESLADAVVHPVLTDHGLPAQEMHAVFPSPKLVPTKVTNFIGFLQRALDGQWWQHAV